MRRIVCQQALRDQSVAHSQPQMDSRFLALTVEFEQFQELGFSGERARGDLPG